MNYKKLMEHFTLILRKQFKIFKRNLKLLKKKIIIRKKWIYFLDKKNNL